MVRPTRKHSDTKNTPERFRPHNHSVAHSSYQEHESRIIRIKECEDPSCDCSTSDCTNVNMNKECPSSCAKREVGCKNQQFRSCYNAIPCFEARKAGKKGIGLFATRFIEKGEFVIVYNGEIIAYEEYLKRIAIYRKNKEKHHYIFQAGSFYIDPTYWGNSARFVNHSCQPNLEVVTRIIDNRKRGFRAIGYVASEPIEEGTEMTVDYNCDYDPETSQRCFCGKRVCTGWIGRSPPKNDQTAQKRPIAHRRSIDFIPSLVDENMEDEELIDYSDVDSVNGSWYAVGTFNQFPRRHSNAENIDPGSGRR